MSNNNICGKLEEMVIPVSSPNLFLFLMDSSASMGNMEERVRENLNRFKLNLTSMDEKGSVIISKANFSTYVSQKPYDTLDAFDISYSADGRFTALYSSICEVSETFLKAVEILQDNGYSPKFTIIVFSDGNDNASKAYFENAKNFIKKINEMGGVTAFVCFGGNISKKVAEDLGFKNIDTQVNLENAFDAISSSCIRQSQSITSLTDTFFDNV